MLLSLSTVTAVHASRPENSSNPGEKIIHLLSYGVIVGEDTLNHHLYLGVDATMLDAFEPLLAAFSGRLYGLETEFGKITIRYEGTFDDALFCDLSEITLGWNGEPLEFDLTFTPKIKHGDKREIVTDIYLAVRSEYEKPGVYSFSGKYKSEPFTLYVKVNPGRAISIPADPDGLMHLSVTSLPFDEKQARPVSDVSFHFAGNYQWFNVNDLRDVRLTNGGADVTFDIHNYIVQHWVFDEDENVTQTIFTLVFINPLTLPGTYQISGRYRDEPFYFRWTQ